MTNRNPIKQWEITYPKITPDVTKEDFHKSFPPSEYTCCAQEYHEDGIATHLHLAIKLVKAITHSKLLNWIKSKFPNDWKRIHFTAIKNWDNFHNYINKEDPCPKITGTLKKINKCLQRVLDTIKQERKTPVTPTSIFELHEFQMKKTEYLLALARLPEPWDEMAFGSKDDAKQKLFETIFL